MIFWSSKTTVVSEGSIPAANSMRTSRVKPRFVRFSRRERIWNVLLPPCQRESSRLCALHMQRDSSHGNGIILYKIRKVQQQVRPDRDTEMPETSTSRRRGV